MLLIVNLNFHQTRSEKKSYDVEFYSFLVQTL